MKFEPIIARGIDLYIKLIRAETWTKFLKNVEVSFRSEANRNFTLAPFFSSKKLVSVP